MRRTIAGRIALAGLVTTAFLLVWLTGLAGLGLHALQIRGQTWHDEAGGLGLSGYRATIEARPIPEIADNLSGLTFNAATDTLFATVNRPAQIVEISTEGRILRHIPVTGGSDLEAMTHVRDELFIVADEASGRLLWVTIGAETATVNLDGAPHMTLDGNLLPNLGIEGLSWDECRGRLFVAHEMWPLRVTVIEGLAKPAPGEASDLTMSEWQPQLALGHSFADLSSLSALDGHGGVLLLSDLTAALAEFSYEGRPLGLMPLWAGWHGLAARIPQAEGIALGSDGAIYIVSEPNLFYRFAPPASAQGGSPQPAYCPTDTAAG